MARMHHLIGFAALAFLVGGCVSSDKFTAQRLENEELRAKLADADAKSRGLEERANAYKAQLEKLALGGPEKDALIINLNKQIADMSAEKADLQRRYDELMSRPAAGPLDVKVSSALDDFAKQNSDLIDFDSARGMVKFKSDLTFATGSADLTEKAKQAIARFAQILNSDAARSYELTVAGHTDNTPVVQPATKAKHPDNWYLSAHRAISVAEQMISQHVSAQRIGATGFGEQRPIASNGSADGKAQNRRVEVMILPSTVRTPTVAKVATPAKSTPKKNLNKDETVRPSVHTSTDNK